jgi:hypothetical protein
MTAGASPPNTGRLTARTPTRSDDENWKPFTLSTYNNHPFTDCLGMRVIGHASDVIFTRCKLACPDRTEAVQRGKLNETQYHAPYLPYEGSWHARTWFGTEAQEQLQRCVPGASVFLYQLIRGPNNSAAWLHPLNRTTTPSQTSSKLLLYECAECNKVHTANSFRIERYCKVPFGTSS